MGEATDRPKTAYAAGVVLGFKNLQLFIQDGTKGGGIRSNKWTQIVHFNSFMQGNLELEPQEEDGTDTTQLKKLPSQPLINTRILAYALYTLYLPVDGSTAPYPQSLSIGLKLNPTNGSRWGKSID
jgi:hypothetical protein